MSGSLESAKVVVDIVSGGVTTLATVLGGYWAYYRFVRGRTFEPRLSLAISSRCIRSDSINYVVCAMEVKNVGLSKVDIDKAHLRLCFLSGESERSYLNTRKVLGAQNWLEPGATLNEQEIIGCMNRYGIVEAEFRVVASRTAMKAKAIIEIPASVVPDIKGQ